MSGDKMLTDYEVAQWIAKLYATPVGNGPFDIVIRESQAHGINCGLVKTQGFQLVIFRGSVSLEDWMHDILSIVPGSEDRPYGFTIGLPDAGPKIVSALDKTLPYIVGGHSLGAPHAEFFCEDFRIDTERLVLLGSPNYARTTMAPNQKQVSYKNGHDYVCDFPLGWVQKYTQTHIDGGHDDFPNLFQWHHIDYYLKGIKKLYPEGEP